MNTKRILIPTDFSKNALNAIHYAQNLFKTQHCEFYILNVFRVEYYTTDVLLIPEPGSAQYEEAKAESEKGLSELLGRLELHPNNPKHKFHPISSYNSISEAIKQIIAKNDIELIVMGTKGASGTKGIIFGSNTVMAMEKIRECPVLAIPENFPFLTPKEIVFPTNFKSPNKRKELNYLIEISQIHKSSVRVLYISKVPQLSGAQESNKILLEKIIEGVDHSFHTIRNNDISKSLTAFVESRDSNMIAFINRKHFFFSSIFSKPLVKEIGYDAIVPILALH